MPPLVAARCDLKRRFAVRLRIEQASLEIDGRIRVFGDDEAMPLYRHPQRFDQSRLRGYTTTNSNLASAARMFRGYAAARAPAANPRGNWLQRRGQLTDSG